MSSEIKGISPLTDIDISRRTFVYGVAATLATTITVGSLAGCSGSSSDEAPDTISASESDITLVSDFTALEEIPATLKDTFELPAGSQLWMDCDSLAAVLFIGETAKPLSYIGMLDVASGDYAIVLEEPVGQNDGCDFYDVRCSETVFAWVEINPLTAAWSVYGALIESYREIGDPVLLDSGTAEYDPPMLTVVDDRVIWTYMPDEDGSASMENSYLRSRGLGDGSFTILYTSNGRMCTAPQQSEGIVTITPRVDTSGIYYAPTALNPTSGEVIRSIVLPKSYKVADAIYIGDTFLFTFESSYDTSGGLGALGTYSELGSGAYLRLAKTPLDTPVYCNGYLCLKNVADTTLIDTTNSTYATIAAPDNCADYGDYLASTGTSSQVVVYSTVSTEADSSDAKVVVRVFDIG